jgi:xylitol oxidase
VDQERLIAEAKRLEPLFNEPKDDSIMNKRMFLKLSTAILGGSSAARLFGGVPDEPASGGKLTNWAGNYRYGTDNLHRLTSIERVRAFVTEHDSLKVLGTRHCFNGIADSNRALISLEPMDRVVALDPKARTVTVEAGMSYGQLCPILHDKGFALHNLASLPHISIAGACATATHGSGIKNGNLATAVSALELVTANGDIVTLSREQHGHTFLGAVVNLGALGAVTKVTLDMEPTFTMRQDVYENLPLAQLTDHFESIVASGYSVSLFTDWQKKRLSEVWVKRRIEQGDAPTATPEFYAATLATKNLHPIAELSAENCTEQMGVPGPWFQRLPHFRMGFTPSSGKELQSEYFVSRSDAVEAILAIERLRDRVGPHLLISELRTVDADQLWLSPCYRRPSLAIHFTWKPDWDSVRKLLPLIETELAPYKVRPHWGKLFAMDPAQLQSRYEKMNEFKELLKEHDPHGKFRNGFLNRNLYG